MLRRGLEDIIADLDQALCKAGSRTRRRAEMRRVVHLPSLSPSHCDDVHVDQDDKDRLMTCPIWLQKSHPKILWKNRPVKLDTRLASTSSKM